METFLAKVAVTFAALALGALLGSTRIFNKQEASAANTAIAYATYPSLVLQSLLTFGCLGFVGPALSASAVVLSLSAAACSWFAFDRRSKADRALLTGATSDAAPGSISYAFVEAVFGPLGLHLAVLWDVGSILSACLLTPLILANGGRAIPEKYIHADGGAYRGQWQGGKKHGLGVYTYPGGARYEGGWAGNAKSGLGVYYYPKGGWFEGEWRDGTRHGVGLRVFKSGAVQGARWHGIQAAERLEPVDCAFVAASAREVAAAAKRVPVGGASQRDSAQRLLAQPAIWAAAVAAASALTHRQIPVVLDFVTAHLATAHIPLTLLVFGLTTDLRVSQSRQVGDIANSLALRLLLPLGAAAVAALALPGRYAEAIAIAAICAIGPISEQSAYYAHLFRLDAQLHGRLASASRLASVSTLSLLAFALVLATPAGSVVGRTQLALALTVVTSTAAVCGSVAAWWLSSRPKGAPASARPGGAERTRPSVGKGSEPSLEDAPDPGIEAGQAIPIGIAWRERELDKLNEGSAPSADESGKQPLQPGVMDTGEASAVVGWAEPDTALVGAQDGTAVDGGVDTQPAADSDPGSGRRDLGPALAPSPTATGGGGAARGGELPSSSSSSKSRRRGRGRDSSDGRGGGRPFEDVEDEGLSPGPSSWYRPGGGPDGSENLPQLLFGDCRHRHRVVSLEAIQRVSRSRAHVPCLQSFRMHRTHAGNALLMR